MHDCLPLMPGETRAGHFLVSTARRLRGPAAGPRRQVLICEDDPLLAMELEAGIAEAGAVCCGTAAGFDEALALADLARPDLALVDLHLADGPSGARLAAELHDLGARVVVLSGSQRIDPRLGRMPHLFLAKPVPALVLQDVLRNLLKALPGEAAGGTEGMAGR